LNRVTAEDFPVNRGPTRSSATVSQGHLTGVPATPAKRSDYNLSTVTVQSLDEHSEHWDRLVDQGRTPTPFLRSWWLDATREKSTRFVLVFEDGRLIGGLPLAGGQGRRWTTYGIPGPTALGIHNFDLVAERTREETVWAHMMRAFSELQPCVLDFTGVSADGVLARRAPASAWVESRDGAPRLLAPPDFETYLASRSRKLRQEIRRMMRHFDAAGVSTRAVGHDQIDRALGTLAHLHALRWGRESGFLPHFATIADATRRASAVGESTVLEALASDGKVVASMLLFEIASHSYWYQMGRDPDPRWSSIGNLLKARAVERSCLLGHRAVDLGSGASPLKTIWADDVTPVIQLRWASGARTRTLLRASVARRNRRAVRRTGAVTVERLSEFAQRDFGRASV
jgi:CelD/BcsL family acetyltransferase involved in cellulose biosynthesis